MPDSSLLWEIIPPQGKASWLFGTMHVKDQRIHRVSHQLHALIDGSDHYIGEMDLSERSAPQDMPVYRARDFLAEKKYGKIRHQLLKSFAVDLDHYQHLHPLLIISIISSSILQSEHLTLLDEHLWEYAEEKGLTMSGLESYDEQFSILHSIDPGVLYKQIEALSRQPWKIRKNALKTLRFYAKGDIHSLYTHSKSSMRGLRKHVIHDRNKKMSSVITQLDTSLQYFISVGAGHLSGKYGLITLLRRSGWKVIPSSLISLSEE